MDHTLDQTEFFEDVENSILEGNELHVSFTLSIMNKTQFVRFLHHVVTHLAQEQALAILEKYIGYAESRGRS